MLADLLLFSPGYLHCPYLSVHAHLGGGFFLVTSLTLFEPDALLKDCHVAYNNIWCLASGNHIIVVQLECSCCRLFLFRLGSTI
jgi:hypothetical protein